MRPAAALQNLPSDADGLELNESQFDTIAAFMHSTAGIRLARGKEGLVRARLMRRIRALQLGGFDPYLRLVARDAAERSHMVDALTTNKTSFFRESAHFDLLRDVLVPVWRESGRPLRIWSAGCSSGEEPYTIAMVLAEALPDAGARVRILATDLSKAMLKKAALAHYGAAQLEEIPAPIAQRHCRRAGSGFQISAGVRGMVRFARLNLMADWPMSGRFDAIFCRNVMIYFDPPTQERLVGRYHAMLHADAHLFIGHSESLSGMSHGFRYVQPAVYVR